MTILKKYILLFSIIIGLTALGIFLIPQYQSEYDSKKNYRNAVKSLNVNWSKNKVQIKEILTRLNNLGFQGEISILEEDELTIYIDCNPNESSDNSIHIGESYEEIILPRSLLEIDSLLPNYYFVGDMQHSHFNFMLMLMDLSKEEFKNLINSLSSVNFHGVSWGKDYNSLTYLGASFSGAFDYILKKDKDPIFYYRIFNKLETDYFWGYQESGLYCNMPFYIPN